MANWFLSESGIRPIRPLPQAFPKPRAGLSTQSYVGFLNNPFSCAPALSSRERKCALQVSSRLKVGSVDEVDFDPGAPPPFKLADVRAAIPKHCWVKDPWKSMSFVVRDVGVVFGLAAAAAYLNNWLVWPLYWAGQGTMFWALFVLGHDCGHGSFSNNHNLNSVVGHLLILQFSCRIMDGELAMGFIIRIRVMPRMMNHGTRCLQKFTIIWMGLPELYDSPFLSPCLRIPFTCGIEALERPVLTSIQTAHCFYPAKGKM